MISYLSGTVIHIDIKYFILNVNGVGYQVFANNETISNIQLDQELKFFIYTSVKEDAINLYGFKTLDELNFFKQLISVSGVGPKTALEILNQPINLIKTAIFTGDSAFLSKTPGIGKKTAERLILELKNKIEIDTLSSLPKNLNKDNQEAQELKEAIEALENLGYKRYEITKTFQQIPTDLKDTENMIKWFLSKI